MLTYLDETVSLGVVDGPELGCPFPAFRVGRENGSSSLTLGTNNTTHGFWQKLEDKSVRSRPCSADDTLEKEVANVNK